MSAEKSPTADAGSTTERQMSHSTQGEGEPVERVKTPWWHSVVEPGSATQIVIAAVLAIAIGVAVSTTVDKVPAAAVTLVGIPGRLWLRALRACGGCSLPTK
jgi:hypothetical protein